MDAADAFGIVVIDESPGVGLQEQNLALPATLAHHLVVEAEHVRRDKNRASVIMWSVANEPESSTPPAAPYFQAVIAQVRALDATRPVLFVCDQDFAGDLAMPYADVIAINRYYAWYEENGELDVITRELTADLLGWRAKYPTKPIMLTEYGADTIPGFHDGTGSPFSWTEDYQTLFYRPYFGVFDAFRTNESFGFIGEHTWCFADFMTVEGTGRAVGNHKGLLTRERAPKAAALQLRARFNAIAAAAPQCPLALRELAESGCAAPLGAAPVRAALPPAPARGAPAPAFELRQAQPPPRAQALRREDGAAAAAPRDGRRALLSHLGARLAGLQASGALAAEEAGALRDALEGA